MNNLISIIESSMHPDLGAMYKELGIQETRVNSIRKAMATVKKSAPDYIICEFFYGYGNNYAGVNISNLDVLLYDLQNIAPDCKVLVIVEKSEYQYVAKLNEIFPLHAIFKYPANKAEIRKALEQKKGQP